MATIVIHPRGGEYRSLLSSFGVRVSVPSSLNGLIAGAAIARFLCRSFVQVDSLELVAKRLEVETQVVVESCDATLDDA